MADKVKANTGNFSDASAKNPLTDSASAPTDQGYMASTMNFFNKHRNTIIGVVILAIIGYVVYKYYFAKSQPKRLSGRARNNARGRKQLPPSEDEYEEDVDEEFEQNGGSHNEGLTASEQEQFDNEAVTDANENFDQEYEENGVEEFNEDGNEYVDETEN